MTPDKLNMILFTVVENICKKLINENYELSDKEGDKKVKKVIEELPYFGVLINCYESNVLNIRVENDYSIKNRLVLLALFMVILICEDMIDQEIQKIEDRSKTIPAIEVSEPNIMVENGDLMLQMP
ncbi:hypothetical protein HK407_06g11570 [Ordospora pajunii]|uniref:uncharacterized protein n=1 Tax=Ordospora pajunii TaxID=3039483 RepID=UPI0029529322|nr:uncharacterized protein HK407_06g11570 [Ordospora pajunii]KAH9411326.1 hypothetical protein HK407_06g11570 [Ordospora pajunii]